MQIRARPSVVPLQWCRKRTRLDVRLGESNYVCKYDLHSDEYVGNLHLSGTPEWTQGLAFFKGDLYITSDDGDADRNEPTISGSSQKRHFWITLLTLVSRELWCAYSFPRLWINWRSRVQHSTDQMIVLVLEQTGECALHLECPRAAIMGTQSGRSMSFMSSKLLVKMIQELLTNPRHSLP